MDEMEQISKEFLKELSTLCGKYNVEIEAIPDITYYGEETGVDENAYLQFNFWDSKSLDTRAVLYRFEGGTYFGEFQ